MQSLIAPAHVASHMVLSRRTRKGWWCPGISANCRAISQSHHTAPRLRRKEHQCAMTCFSRTSKRNNMRLASDGWTFDNHGPRRRARPNGVGATLTGGIFKEWCPSPELSIWLGQGTFVYREWVTAAAIASRVCAVSPMLAWDSVLQRSVQRKHLIKCRQRASRDLLSKDRRRFPRDLDPDRPLGFSGGGGGGVKSGN